MRLTSIRLLRCVRPACWTTGSSLREPHTSAAPVSAARRTVGLTRLERVTSPLSEECSNRLSYRPGQPVKSGRCRYLRCGSGYCLTCYCSLGAAKQPLNLPVKRDAERPAYTLTSAEATGRG